jgi:CubicO group peptidase (beta-lactamase class C family)
MARNNLMIAGAIAVFAATAAGGVYLNGLARVAAAYEAKALCSEVFVAGRPADAVLAAEFNGINPAFAYIGARIDERSRQVDASLFGLGRARASYREGFGCTIEAGGEPAPLAALQTAVTPRSWEEAPENPGLAEVDRAAIEAALAEAFGNEIANTRAMLVAVDGRIVAERYAPGFDAATPFLSWSMAKSVTASLVGAAALRGYLNVDDPAPVPEWQGDRARAAITWDDLLRMQSGLEFDESYGDPSSDVSTMLFRAREAGAVAAAKPLIHQPGEVWSYSSGTTNLVARTLSQALAERGIDYFEFAREALFAPLGAASFVLEPDSAGNSIGSSYIYATARDWARLGQLYLEGGVWNGERLLPEDWSDYVSTPTRASDGEYGAHFWLNLDGSNGRVRWVPGLPEEVYSMSGHEGQYVFIIPDRRMIIVRTGMTREALPIEVVGPTLAAIYRAAGASQSAGAQPGDAK